MNLLEQILNCSDEEIDDIITTALNKSNDNATKIDMIGFLPNLRSNNIHKGFIPLNTRIKYSTNGMEDYSMNSTDVICSDKTGTITQNKMIVKSIYVNGKLYSDLDSFDSNILNMCASLNHNVQKVMINI